MTKKEIKETLQNMPKDDQIEILTEQRNGLEGIVNIAIKVIKIAELPAEALAIKTKLDDVVGT